MAITTRSGDQESTIVDGHHELSDDHRQGVVDAFNVVAADVCCCCPLLLLYPILIVSRRLENVINLS